MKIRNFITSTIQDFNKNVNKSGKSAEISCVLNKLARLFIVKSSL